MIEIVLQLNELLNSTNDLQDSRMKTATADYFIIVVAYASKKINIAL